MASQLFSTFTEIGLVDTRVNAGTILLPKTIDIPYRQISLKDIYGNFQNKSLTLTTQFPDTFEDGTTTKVFTNAFGFTTLYSGVNNVWYTLGGTVLTSQTVSSLTVSTISGNGGALRNLPAISTLSLQSTVEGLGSIGYISTLSLRSTVAGLGSSYISTQSLYSSLIGMGTLGYISSIQFSTTITGLGSIGYISSSQLLSTVAGLGQIYVSTVTGASFNGSTTTLSAAIITVSTLSTNMIMANNIYTSGLSTTSLVFGTGAGTLLMPDIAPNTVYASTVTASNVQVGWNTNQSPIQFYGAGNYTNSVIVEQSTSATTQELLFFRGSNATDRFRFQTTGYFSIETGVSSRLYPTTSSNAVPSFTIDINSNVGIKLAAPGAPLDVNGIARATTFSSISMLTSSFTVNNINSVFMATSSVSGNIVGANLTGTLVNGTTMSSSNYTGRWNDAVYYVLQTI